MRSFEKKDFKPSSFAHAVLKTSHYEAMVGFYKTLLNAHVAFGDDMVTFLTYDDEHHRVAILRVPDLKPRDPSIAGVHHWAYTYPTLGDLLGNYVRLKKQGILPYLPINHGPTTSIYYRDPDGNMIETQIDNFPDVATTNEYMRSEEFKKNPVGVEFDPDRLVERYLAGDDEVTLKQRGSAPTPRGDAPPMHAVLG